MPRQAAPVASSRSCRKLAVKGIAVNVYRLLVALLGIGFAMGAHAHPCDAAVGDTGVFRFEVREGYESRSEATRRYTVIQGCAVPNRPFVVEVQNAAARLREMSAYNARAHGFAMAYEPSALLGSRRLELCLADGAANRLSADSMYALSLGAGVTEGFICGKQAGTVYVGFRQWQTIASESGDEPYVVQFRLMPEKR